MTVKEHKRPTLLTFLAASADCALAGLWAQVAANIPKTDQVVKIP
jgi:hypothetical protein